MNEQEFRHVGAVTAVLLGVVVFGYMASTEREAARQDQAFSEWMYKNGLSDFRPYLFEKGALKHFIIL